MTDVDHPPRLFAYRTLDLSLRSVSPRGRRVPVIVSVETSSVVGVVVSVVVSVVSVIVAVVSVIIAVVGVVVIAVVVAVVAVVGVVVAAAAAGLGIDGGATRHAVARRGRGWRLIDVGW